MDGSQHYDLLQREQDDLRTRCLEKLRVNVLRFSNLEVLRQFKAVCEAIDMSVRERAATFTNCNR